MIELFIQNPKIEDNHARMKYSLTVLQSVGHACVRINSMNLWRQRLDRRGEWSSRIPRRSFTVRFSEHYDLPR